VTGEQPNDADIADVRTHCRLPLLLGSGITAENLGHYYAQADGFIVGSFFKKDGRWNETVDSHRVERFMAVHSAASA
jgi:predicted TIM-barrel enzyme